ncbi:MAG: TetR/AcrR family transcriptional regulator [Lewinellaceae bacterium]|nr:TetR/AcrR family transcriptional regulator [Lewinellaceae bacterium]
MSRNTKQRILDAALQLFNEEGYVNVRLAQIAELADMSVGNMAYHFPHKEQILEGIYDELLVEQRRLLAEINLAPLFENFDYFLRATYGLQKKYIFFYLDTLELVRASAGLKKAHQEHVQWQRMQLELLLQLNRARGVLDWKAGSENPPQLARHLRHVMDSWHSLQLIEGEDADDFNGYRACCWSVLQPYFTDMGWKEYGQLAAKPGKFIPGELR